MHKRVSNRDARRYIERREEFETHTGSLWGAYAGGLRTGYLPAEWRERLREAQDRAGDGLYVVYSYSTPIAWWDGEQWTQPDVKYSATTSRHQGLTPWDGAR